MLKVKGECSAPSKNGSTRAEFEIEALEYAEKMAADTLGYTPLKNGTIVKMDLWFCYRGKKTLIAKYDNGWIKKPCKKDDKAYRVTYKKIRKMFNHLLEV